MRIVVCSDIHDNIWKLESAIPMMAGAKELIFCGDFCAPFTLAQLAEGFRGKIHVVFGNNDGDVRLLMQISEKARNVVVYGQTANLRLGGLRIGVNHYPDLARHMSLSNNFDVVCYGHDHLLHEEQVNNTLLMNPGEIMGRFGRSTFMVLDTDTRSTTVHEVN